jgi:hypothetical protein
MISVFAGIGVIAGRPRSGRDYLFASGNPSRQPMIVFALRFSAAAKTTDCRGKLLA